MKKMDTIDTDKDIISYVKRQFFANEVSDYIFFYVTLKPGGHAPDVAWSYGPANIEEMTIKLFDLSLTSRICSIDAMTDWKNRLCALEVVVEESPDHQTNITGNLVDLFRILADPYGIERLKPVKTYSCDANVIATTGEFTTLTVNDTAIDPWEQFET